MCKHEQFLGVCRYDSQHMFAHRHRVSRLRGREGGGTVDMVVKHISLITSIIIMYLYADFSLSATSTSYMEVTILFRTRCRGYEAEGDKRVVIIIAVVW